MRVAILGAGVMGCQIAQTCALSDHDVVLRDVRQEVLDQALLSIKWNTDTLLQVGAFGQTQAEAAMSRIMTTLDVKEALESANVVIEAVPEDLNLKKKVFAEVDSHAPSAAILGTNTSGLSITEISLTTKRPENVVGIHFVSPAYICRTVEVVKAKLTSDQTFEKAVEFVKTLKGKVPFRVL